MKCQGYKWELPLSITVSLMLKEPCEAILGPWSISQGNKESSHKVSFIHSLFINSFIHLFNKELRFPVYQATANHEMNKMGIVVPFRNTVAGETGQE
jgi:hypothetical protein